MKCIPIRVQHAHFVVQSIFRWSDTIYVTKQQLETKPVWMQRAYKFVRHPAVFLWFAPLMNWFVDYRIPISTMSTPASAKVVNTVGVIAELVLLHFFGPTGIVLPFVGAVFASCVYGITLFHCQHTFNPGYVVESNWSKELASLRGTSILLIPWWLKWFTMGIEYHHIHHLNSRVPGYNLRRCHEGADAKFWQSVPRLGGKDMLRSLTYTLWDEELKMFV